LHRASDDPQRPEIFSRVAQLHGELEALRHHVGGDAIAIVLARSFFERGDRVAIELCSRVARGGGVIGELVLVTGDAGIGRRDRIERRVGQYVLVGDLVHLRHAHQLLMSPAPDVPGSGCPETGFRGVAR